jgi:hypothetical protein
MVYLIPLQDSIDKIFIHFPKIGAQEILAPGVAPFHAQLVPAYHVVDEIYHGTRPVHRPVVIPDDLHHRFREIPQPGHGLAEGRMIGGKHLSLQVFVRPVSFELDEGDVRLRGLEQKDHPPEVVQEAPVNRWSFSVLSLLRERAMSAVAYECAHKGLAYFDSVLRLLITAMDRVMHLTMSMPMVSSDWCIPMAPLAWR